MPYLRGSFSSSSYSYSSSSSRPPISPMRAQDDIEPIAICGMACRLPGSISSPSALWDLLLAKKTTNSDKVPASRFNIDAHYHKNPNRPGSFNVRGGYFLDEHPEKFDPTFFNITPVEAMWMDPQQRKMLEVCYEALESAGVPLESIAGTPTGVYLGQFTSDSQSQAYHSPSFRHSYSATGIDPGIISARVSNIFDLSGPSLTLNTACSSSIYALHLACNALRARDCDAALVGGVNLMLSVEQHMDIAKLGVQSPSSFSHTFDASADGYGRAEGVGVVYIKRLGDALREGDIIRSVIRSSAVGANGKVPGYGLTFPSMSGQEKVIRQAYKRGAGLDPRDTAYVECHGTGTPVGDPIEVRALAGAMGTDTRGKDRRLVLGAMKPNIGHSEAASGVSALIKAALVVEKGIIPGVAGLKKLNGKIEEDKLGVEIAREVIEIWPGGYKSRRAGVSSFGYGGTNGHVILENVEALEPEYRHGGKKGVAGYDHSTGKRPLLVTFAAHDRKTLRRNIEAHGKVAGEYYLADLAHTLNLRRSKFAGGPRAYAIMDETSISTSFSLPDFKISTSSPSTPKEKTVAFIFTGQGSQWPRAGHSALLTFPIFRATIRRLDRVLKSGAIQPLPTFSIEEEISRPAETSRVTEADLSQPTLVALEIATVDLLASWGITPTATVGHSAGESAAAYAAGLCSAPEVIIAAYYRGWCARRYGAEGGGMLAVGLGVGEMDGYAGRIGEKVVIACENSPKSITLSGPRGDILKAKEVFDKDGVFAREVRTPMAYHSRDMMPVAGPMVESIKDACGRLDSLDKQWRYPRRMMVSSSIQGNPVIVDEREITAQYWANNLKGRVLFDTAVAKMATLDGVGENLGAVVEIGPHSALAGPFKQIRQGHGLDPGLGYVPTMVRNEDCAKSLIATAGELHLLGFDHMVDLVEVNKVEMAQTTWIDHHKKAELKPLFLVDLPPYQWNYDDNKIYSAEPRTSIESRQLTHPRHDLLGSKILGLSSQSMVWTNILRVRDIPWLVDHRLGGSNMFPAAGHMALAIEAVRQHFEVHGENNGISISSVRGITLRNVVLKAALVVPDTEEGPFGGLEIQTRLTEDLNTKGTFHFTISSLGDSVKNIWTVHSSGEISLIPNSLPSSTTLEAPDLIGQEMKFHSAKRWNKAFQRVGFSYTGPFNALKGIRSSDSKFTATCEIPLTTRSGLFPGDEDDGSIGSQGGGESRYILHPATVDSLLQLCIISIHKGRDRNMKFGVVPTLFDEVTFYFPPGGSGDDGVSYHGIAGQAIAWNDTSDDYIPGITRRFKTNARLSSSTTGDIALDIKGLHTLAYEAALPPDVADIVDAEMILKKMEEQLPPMPYAGVVWKPDISFLVKTSRRTKLTGTCGPDAVVELVDLLNHKNPIASLLILDSASRLDIERIVERTCLTAEVSLWGREWDVSGMEDVLASRVVKVLGQEGLRLKGETDETDDAQTTPELVIFSLEDTSRFIDDTSYEGHLSLNDQGNDNKRIYLVHQSREEQLMGKLAETGFEVLNEFSFSDGELASQSLLALVVSSQKDTSNSGNQPQSQSNGSANIATSDWDANGIITPVNLATNIAILYPGSHSPSAPASLATVLTSQGHTVQISPLQDFTANPSSPPSSALTILYDPTGSILSQHSHPDNETFSFLKDLLSSSSKTNTPIIWLTSGVNQGTCPSPCGASVAGFLRVIREEDESVNIKVLDYDPGESVEDVASAVVGIASMGQTDEGEREFWVKDGGAVHISRVIPNRELNGRGSLNGVHHSMGDEKPEQEQETGKGVAQGGKPLKGVPSPSHVVTFSPNDIYLLVGCLGGLGRSLSKWMISRGARHLYYISRSGDDSPAAKDLLASITAQGALPKVFRGDVSSREDVNTILQTIITACQISTQRIRGVIHAAMVLRDGYFLNDTMTSERFAESLRPKAQGALNLLEALQTSSNGCGSVGIGLDFFLTTSSISATVGQPGQSNYAAGNAVLDNLALWQKQHPQQGLRGQEHHLLKGTCVTSLVLPMVLGVGVVAETSSVDLESAISKRGMYGVDEVDMLKGFEDSIALSMMKQQQQKENQLDEGSRRLNGAVIMGLDPGRLARTWGAAAMGWRKEDESDEEEEEDGDVDQIWELDNGWIREDARFRHVKFLADTVMQVMEEHQGKKEGGKVAAGTTPAKFTDQVKQVAATTEDGAGYSAALEMTARHIMTKCGSILMIPPVNFDMEGKSVGSYGLDSMVGAELRNWLFKELGLNIAFQDLLASSLSFGGLARLVLRCLGIPPSEG